MVAYERMNALLCLFCKYEIMTGLHESTLHTRFHIVKQIELHMYTNNIKAALIYIERMVF